MARFESDFDIGDMVYHVADKDGEKGIVIDITFRGSGNIIYGVNWGHATQAYHYQFELTKQKVYNN